MINEYSLIALIKKYDLNHNCDFTLINTPAVCYVHLTRCD